jgi:hypothetical protein
MKTPGEPDLGCRRYASVEPTDRPLHLFRTVETTSPPRRRLSKPEGGRYPDRSKKDKSKKERNTLTLRPSDPGRNSDYDYKNPKYQQAFNHSLVPSN